MKVLRNGSNALIDTGVNVYAIEAAAEDRYPFGGVQPYFSGSNIPYPMRIGQFEIVPNGSQNNLPRELREILDENNIAPELLNKKTQLLWG